MIQTHILDVNNGVWSNGPVLNSPRAVPGCGKVLIQGKPYIFVTGGMDGGNTGPKIEYLDVSNIQQGWKLGQDFPLPWCPIYERYRG